MAGTIEGGKKASQTNKERYGHDFYQRIGRRRPTQASTGGFYANRELARRAGRIGGKKK